MKRALAVAAAVLILASSGLALAAGDGGASQRPEPTFEQKKANILKILDQRMSKLLEEKACIDAAKNDEELNVCREKHLAERKQLEDRTRQREQGKRDGQPAPPAQPQK